MASRDQSLQREPINASGTPRETRAQAASYRSATPHLDGPPTIASLLSPLVFQRQKKTTIFSPWISPGNRALRGCRVELVTKLKKVAFPSLVLFSPFLLGTWRGGIDSGSTTSLPIPSSPFSGGHGLVSVLQHSLVSSSPRTNDSSTSIPPRKSGAALVIESPLLTDGHVACGPQCSA